MRLGKMAMLSACVLALAAMTSAVRANTINLTLQTVTANGSNWDFTYDVTLTGGSMLMQGDYATLYDFEGFISLVSPPSPSVTGAWTVSHQQTGVDVPGFLTTQFPFGTIPDTNLENVTIVYTGSTFEAPSDQEVSVTTLVVTSSYGYVRRGYDVVSSDHMSSGSPQFAHHSTNGPTAIPLPAAAWSGLVLMAAIGLLRSRKVK